MDDTQRAIHEQMEEHRSLTERRPSPWRRFMSLVTLVLEHMSVVGCAVNALVAVVDCVRGCSCVW